MAFRYIITGVSLYCDFNDVILFEIFIFIIIGIQKMRVVHVLSLQTLHIIQKMGLYMETDICSKFRFWQCFFGLKKSFWLFLSVPLMKLMFPVPAIFLYLRILLSHFVKKILSVFTFVQEVIQICNII